MPAVCNLSNMKKVYFAGIGGIRLGFDRAFGEDIETVFVSEWDKYAQETYKLNYHDSFPIAGDITQIKEEDIPETEKNELTDVEKQIADKEDAIKAIYTDYATGNKVVHELIDLALLQNGMLKGEALNSFIKRSVELI